MFYNKMLLTVQFVTTTNQIECFNLTRVTRNEDIKYWVLHVVMSDSLLLLIVACIFIALSDELIMLSQMADWGLKSIFEM